MKLSGNMYLMIVLKVTKKNRALPLSRKNSFGKTTGGSKIDPHCLLRVKKDKMINCGAPGCNNRADKNPNMLNISYNNNAIIIRSQHIQNPVIFNNWGIFKTLSNIWDDDADWKLWWHSQNSLFRRFQEYWGALIDIDTYSGTEVYSDILRTLCTLAYTTIPYSGLWYI